MIPSLTGQQVRVLAVKTGPRALEQGRYLQSLQSTEAFVRVETLLPDGYTMEVLEPIMWTDRKRAAVVERAVRLLQFRYVDLGVEWQFNYTQFYKYLRARASKDELKSLERMEEEISFFDLDERVLQHGDLTWENVMIRPDGTPMFIDALPPGAGTLPAPLTDAGKLYLSSLAGWRGATEAVPPWDNAGHVAAVFEVSILAVRFAAATHLLRVRPYARRTHDLDMIKFCEENIRALLGV